MVMGYDVGNQYFQQTDNQFIGIDESSETGNLKNETFSILSIIPFYRYSKR